MMHEVFGSTIRPDQQTVGGIRLKSDMIPVPIVTEALAKHHAQLFQYDGIHHLDRAKLADPAWQKNLPVGRVLFHVGEREVVIGDYAKVSLEDTKAKTVPFQALVGSNKDFPQRFEKQENLEKKHRTIVIFSGSWQTAAGNANYLEELLKQYDSVIIMDSTVSRGTSGAHSPFGYASEKQQALQMADFIRQITEQLGSDEIVSCGISLGGHDQLLTMVYLQEMHEAGMFKPDVAGSVFHHAADIARQKVVDFIKRVMKSNQWKTETDNLLAELATLNHADQEAAFKRIEDVYPNIVEKSDGRGKKLRELTMQYAAAVKDEDLKHIERLHKEIYPILQPIVNKIQGSPTDARDEKFIASTWPWAKLLHKTTKTAPHWLRKLVKFPVGLFYGKNDGFFPEALIEQTPDIDNLFPNTKVLRKSAANSPHVDMYVQPHKIIPEKLIPFIDELTAA